MPETLKETNDSLQWAFTNKDVCIWWEYRISKQWLHPLITATARIPSQLQCWDRGVVCILASFRRMDPGTVPYRVGKFETCPVTALIPGRYTGSGGQYLSPAPDRTSCRDIQDLRSLFLLGVRRCLGCIRRSFCTERPLPG